VTRLGITSPSDRRFIMIGPPLKLFSTAELLARGREDGSGPPCLHGDVVLAAGS
jgi:hypothetical protein